MDLTYEELVNSYVRQPGFIERPWLNQAVEEALANPACHFVILVAPPGFGKTAFAAGLAARHPDWVRYFIRRDQMTPLSDTGIRSFLLRIGYQLAALYPNLFTLERVQITVEQRIGSAVASSEIMGAEVIRLVASPFYAATLRIRQAVERQTSGVSGLRIEELVVDPRLVPVESLQFSALLDVAIALNVVDPTAQLTVLVDAVDELRYAESHETLLDWCSTCPELPPNLRFVLTSRPDDELLASLRQRQAAWLREVTIDAQSSEVRGDVYRYAAGHAAEESIERIVTEQGMQLETFLQAVVASAAGNLGYVTDLFRDIHAAIAEGNDQRLTLLLELETLPSSLERLYAFFLHQIKASIGRELIELTDHETGEIYYKPVWPTIYNRVLGILAVALEPLTIQQIAEYGKIDAETLGESEALERLAQLLMHSENRYRLFHQSFVEFLTSTRTKEQPETVDLYVDAGLWHSRICSSTLAKLGLEDTRQVRKHLGACVGKE